MEVSVTFAVPDGTSVASSRTTEADRLSGGATACSTIDSRMPVRSSRCHSNPSGCTKSKRALCRVSPDATAPTNCGLDLSATLVKRKAVQWVAPDDPLLTSEY